MIPPVSKDVEEKKKKKNAMKKGIEFEEEVRRSKSHAMRSQGYKSLYTSRMGRDIS